MSPALLALLTPVITGLVGLISGPAETWLVDHVLTYVAGFIARQVKFNAEWGLSGATDPANGIVTVTITRSGRTAIVLVFYALAMTASHQANVAALLGALFHEGEEKALGWFKEAMAGGKAAPIVAPAT